MSNFDELLFVNQEKKLRGFEKLLRAETRQAVMLIEAPKDMGKTWLVGKMQHHCLLPNVGLAVVYIDFRNPRQIYEMQDVLGLLRFMRNELDHPAYFSHLNNTINSFTRAHAGSGGLAGLRQNIETYFTLDELKTITFDLGITYENLAGDTLVAKSRELVNYCQRYNLLSTLIDHCRLLRPEVAWWEGLEAYRETAAPAAAAPGTSMTVEDNNAPIWADSDVERHHAERQINQAFFECLAQLMADKPPIVFLFDSFENAPPEVEQWLQRELLLRLRDEALKDVVVIISGRKTPDLTDLEMKHLLVQTSLDPFTEEHIREYFMERREIAGLDLRTIMVTSGGVPGALAMMADHAMATASADDDFFSDL